MPHAVWTGSISFGLVTIPVKLQTAVRANDLRFNMLHKQDEGRIQNVRRCGACGKDVAFDEIEKGYEVEKGRYVVLTEEDFKRVDAEATQSVDIMQFVEAAEIDEMLYDRPYYLEPEKKGRHAYALLREALRDAKKVGIARVVVRSREHLAALRPHGDALVLELMHFADEIVDPGELDFPASEKSAAGEMKMARTLIESMTESFDPAAFRDRYRDEVLAMIEARAAGAPPPKPPGKAPRRDNVVDLMDVLQKSLEARKRGRGEHAAEAQAIAVPPAVAERKPTRRKKSAA